MGVAVVIALVEKVRFFLLHEIRKQVEQQGKDQSNESGFESRGQTGDDWREAIADLGCIRRKMEFAHGHAESEHGANKPEHGDRPNHRVDEGIAGSNLIFVVVSLAFEDGGEE